MRYVYVMRICFAVACFVNIVPNYVCAELGDPYKILGIGEKATLQEIRRAYKQLAKEWYVFLCDRTDQINFTIVSA